MQIPKGNMVAFAWNTIVLLMMLGFASSIVTSVAQGVLVAEQRSEMVVVEAQQRGLPPSENSGRDRTEKWISQ